MNGPLNFINAILYINLILIGRNWLTPFEPFCIPIIHIIYIYIIISYDIPIITSLSPCFSNVFLQLLVLFLIKTQSCGYPDIAEGMWKCRSAMASEPLLSPAVPLRRQNWVQNGWDHRKLWVKPCCCELCEFCWWKKRNPTWNCMLVLRSPNMNLSYGSNSKPWFKCWIMFNCSQENC